MAVIDERDAGSVVSAGFVAGVEVASGVGNLTKGVAVDGAVGVLRDVAPVRIVGLDGSLGASGERERRYQRQEEEHAARADPPLPHGKLANQRVG